MTVTSRSRTQARTTQRVDVVLGVVLLVGIGLPLLSSALGLYEHVQHWGKVVHAVDGFCATLLFGLLLLAWREYAQVDLTDELSGLLTIFFGIFFGVMWEIVEFARDWVAYSDLEKSNTDTMTDFLCNDVATLVAALFALRLYYALSNAERQSLSRTAEWLVDGPSRVLDRHGLLIGGVAAVAILALLAALWFSGRPVPGIPIP